MPQAAPLRRGAARRRPIMIATIQILVLLLIAISAVAIVAARVNIPSSILLVITGVALALLPGDRKSTRLNSSHLRTSRMPSSA